MKSATALVVAALLIPAAGASGQSRAPRPWANALAETAFAPSIHLGDPGVADLFRQTVIANPSTIEFAASPDHDAIDAGQPVVTSYDITILPAAGGAAVKTANIGKPTPVAGKVTLTTFQTVWAGLPAGSYKAQAVAKGAGGAAVGPISVDPFTVTPRAPAAPGAPTFRQ